MSSNLLFKSDATSKMLFGINKISEAVSSTLGPHGRNVVIFDGDGIPHVTKDGITVAKSITLEDPFENVGAQLIKTASMRTSDNAGDGTTTSIVLSDFLCTNGSNLISSGIKPIDIKNGMELALCDFKKLLNKHKIDISGDYDKLLSVATISSNNDTSIGKTIADLFWKIGNYGSVSVSESKTNETKYSVSNGMSVPFGLISQHLCTDRVKSESRYEDASILITDEIISSVEVLIPLLQAGKGQPLVIICSDMGFEAVNTIVANNMKGLINVSVVKASGYGFNKLELLNDIAVYTGASVISDEYGISMSSIQPKDIASMLGKCKLISSNQIETTIIGKSKNSDKLNARISELKTQIELEEDKYLKNKILERIARLCNGIGHIYVGASSDAEIKEKLDRVDDAVCASKSALNGGIVLGGGMTYLSISNAMKLVAEKLKNTKEYHGYMLVVNALKSTLIKICENSGVEYSDVESKCASGKYFYDAKENKFVSKLNYKVYDPFQVSENAVENSISAASMFILTSTIVIK